MPSFVRTHVCQADADACSCNVTMLSPHGVTVVDVMWIRSDESVKAWFITDEPYFWTRKDFAFAGGLYFSGNNHRQRNLVVPDGMYGRTEAIEMMHDSKLAAHPGIDRTQLLVAQYFHWPLRRRRVVRPVA
ncbi:hypothetical protein SDRG_03060 [Saprolegnia diclina VS20]|uniref:Integrase zinc-binding domain-containing protein n=1 Tax=Saprolegnia diclina (strain VS20) TaxID=1156394 RepID=T0QNG6_SAPDV|nr:hypothetical protein SDRG_03060 [Saprolegnia diclina VS20]EQC39629.1 hypothetical protein SDRG_03060 [Saprolegnia diclina VS20]|eukprot:XP_008606901.1 hypothetical protein SDRG_03060 [Saprolegnia diclina VS20]